MNDYDMARHWFGLLASDTGYFQVTLTIAVFLTLHSSVKRWIDLRRGGN